MGNQNSGRKSKKDELAMIKKLTPLDDMAFTMLESGIINGEFQYLKLFFEYRFGKPTQMQEINLTSEQDKPMINIKWVSTDSE